MEPGCLRIISTFVTLSVLIFPLTAMNHTEIHYIDNYIVNFIDSEAARLYILNVQRIPFFENDYYPGKLIIQIIKKCLYHIKANLHFHLIHCLLFLCIVPEGSTHEISSYNID